MEENEQPIFRPTEADFSERIRDVREAQDSDPDAYETYITEIQRYAKGEGDPEIREQFYPGWATEDFESLWQQLEEEGLTEE